jgi:4-amino-4-deoxy-L-arabinose transferase-like glycosyltransferase
MKKYVLAVLGFVLAAQAFLLTRPFPFLITDLVPDDGFYYFEIARNIVQGQGSVFGGGEFTNGYHPLWMIVLLPIFALFSSGSVMDITPVYAALAVSAFLHLATVYLVYRLAERVSGKPVIASVATLIYGLNPFLLYETLNGLETSLSLFLLSLTLTYWVRWQDSLSLKRALIIGALFGLTALARLDLGVFAIAFGMWLIVKRPHAWFRLALASGAACIVLVSPWFIWNYMHTGTTFTSASETAPFVNRNLVMMDNGPGLMTVMKAIPYHGVFYARSVLVQTGMPLMAILIAGFLAYHAWRHRKQASLRSVAPEAWAFAGWTLLFIANAMIRWTGRSWYFVSLNIFLALGAAYAMKLMSSHARGRHLPVALFLIALPCFAWSWQTEVAGRERAQLEMFAASRWVSENVPQGSVIGVFNAGVHGYFSSHDVVNIDGLVNNAASRAMLAKDLWGYIEDKKIDYIVDFPIYMSYRYKPLFGVPDVFEYLEPVHTISLGAHNRSESGLTIYRLKQP